MSADQTLKSRFDAAVASTATLPKQGPTVQLTLYGLYKQATQGDATGKRPGAFDLKGRAKFDAWAGHQGLSADDAMTAYIDQVTAIAAG